MLHEDSAADFVSQGSFPVRVSSLSEKGFTEANTSTEYSLENENSSQGKLYRGKLYRGKLYRGKLYR